MKKGFMILTYNDCVDIGDVHQMISTLYPQMEGVVRGLSYHDIQGTHEELTNVSEKVLYEVLKAKFENKE